MGNPGLVLCLHGTENEEKSSHTWNGKQGDISWFQWWLEPWRDGNKGQTPSELGVLKFSKNYLEEGDWKKSEENCNTRRMSP